VDETSTAIKVQPTQNIEKKRASPCGEKEWTVGDYVRKPNAKFKLFSLFFIKWK
jgi:hypothetical protein